MNLLLSILAASNDTSRFVFGLIFIAIWVIGALAKNAGGMVKKSKDRLQEIRDAMERDLNRSQNPRPPVVLDPELQRRIPPPVMPRMGKKRPPVRRAPVPSARQGATNYNAMALQPRRKPAPPRPPPPQLPEAAPEPAIQSRLAPEETPAAAPPTRVAPGISAAKIHRWLQPATLQQQFILTELFQPPLALRESHLQR